MNSDIDAFLKTEMKNGGTLWSSADGSIGKGGAFSTLEAGMFLRAFGYTTATGTKLEEIGTRIFENQKADSRFRAYATGAVYPCHTINATRSLCLLGFHDDPRLDGTIQYLLETQDVDGGWRCNSFKYGHGPETESSNPGPTLSALDIFRVRKDWMKPPELDKAVEFLLQHWVTRAPLGPCHYGIGSQFFKVEYPMVRYNLLSYVYILSFYNRAVRDVRFQEALRTLKTKIAGDTVLIEKSVIGLKEYSFYRERIADTRAFECYSEIAKNIEEPPRI